MKKILIIGDSCIDEFIYGKCERICPEAPVPILLPSRIIRNGGMALNVEANVKSLGSECDIITNDIKPIKKRFVEEDSNHILLRVDENDNISRIPRKRLMKINFSNYYVVIISDYNKGFLTTHDIEFISSNHNNIFMDSKKKLGEWCCGVNFLKINEKEFKENKDFLKEYFSNCLITTNGKFGATLNYKEKFSIEYSLEVRDLSGAGDTFLAALVSNFIKTKNIRKSIIFANRCASWVVTQKGVVPIDLTKI